MKSFKEFTEASYDVDKWLRMNDQLKKLRDAADRAESGKRYQELEGIHKRMDSLKAKMNDLRYGESIEEGSESWEDGYKRRVVKTTKPEHKEKGYNWRIKGKDKAHLTIKLYKDKPSQAEFNKQMKRVAGHEFGG